jgi:hypothetical protein
MNSFNLSRILTILTCAQADIEGLTTVAGVNPHSQKEMLAENYQAQWATLQELASVIQQLTQGLSTEDTQAVIISDLPFWLDKAHRLMEIGAESNAVSLQDLSRLIALDEERAEIETEMAAYLVSLLHSETAPPN